MLNKESCYEKVLKIKLEMENRMHHVDKAQDENNVHIKRQETHPLGAAPSLDHQFRVRFEICTCL